MDRSRILAALDSTDPPLTTRIRIENGYTIKDGHSYSSTVEITYQTTDETMDEDAEIVLQHLRSSLRLAREEGIRERDARNREDGR